MGWECTNLEKPYANLEVWRLGMALVRQIYSMTDDFPTGERFELVSQLRSAAVSVPSNIAEGSARRTTADFLRFLYQARGSLVEIDTQMRLAQTFGYLQEESANRAQETFEQLSRALQGLITKLEQERVS